MLVVVDAACNPRVSPQKAAPFDAEKRISVKIDYRYQDLEIVEEEISGENGKGLSRPFSHRFAASVGTLSRRFSGVKRNATVHSLSRISAFVRM